MTVQLPSLTDLTIRGRANGQSYARGYDYFRNDAVQNIVWRSGMLTAEVQGSDNDPYQVQVLFRGNEIAHATCSCPYDWGGDCKHIVAVLLTLLNTPDVVAIRLPLESLLTNLNADQLRTLLFDVAEYAPQVLDFLEQRVVLMRGASLPISAAIEPSAPVSAPPPPSFDATWLKRLIKASVRDIARTTNEYDEGYEIDLSESLAPAMELAQKFLDSGNPPNALEVLKVAAEAFEEATDNLDDYVLEAQEDVIDEQMLPFAEIWTEAFLSATWTREQKIYWLEELEELIESMFGGSALMMAQTALQHGWTYPPLVAAMRGEFDERGAWEDEAPDYADELAEIRLRVLEKRGDWDSYLNLARAEGHFLRYLQALIKLGRTQQACDEARHSLSSPSSIVQIVQDFAAVGDREHAIELGRYGLTLTDTQGMQELATWLREYASAQGDSALALQAAQTALQTQLSLQNYLAWKQQAGERWDVLKPQALQIVAASQRAATEKIEIYLYEKMHAELIALIDTNAFWYYDLHKVISAVQYDFPEWAIERSKKQAEQIMDAGKSNAYGDAAKWLKTARDILLRIGKKQDWQAYLSNIKQTHARKYRLMDLLQAL